MDTTPIFILTRVSGDIKSSLKSVYIHQIRCKFEHLKMMRNNSQVAGYSSLVPPGGGTMINGIQNVRLRTGFQYSLRPGQKWCGINFCGQASSCNQRLAQLLNSIKRHLKHVLACFLLYRLILCRKLSTSKSDSKAISERFQDLEFCRLK